jgi:hypothetical protein
MAPSLVTCPTTKVVTPSPLAISIKRCVTPRICDTEPVALSIADKPTV